MSKQRADGSVIINVEADLSKFNASLSKIAKAGTAALATIGVSAGLVAKQVIDVGVGFESAFAGVKKTVNASTAELEGFRKEILNLSTDIPQTANAIANIAESAGQLGIQNDALMGFTRTMADLGVATNMGATEAATTLARFANITQMSQKDFDRLGSTIVELGNNLATTEAEIADMALNIAGAGHQVGMTEPQILALSAALSSVGIEAAAGGTAMSTLMIEIKKATVLGGKDLEKFANVANMSASDFKEAFEKDAGKAIQTFIEGLGSASERGVDAIALLNDAGLTDVRMTRALLNAANASEVFSSSFELADKAWEENIALTKEAAQRYETTESKMQILNNTIAKAGITAFEKFKEPFKDALDTGIDSVNELTTSLENGRLGQSVDNVAKSFSDLVSTIIKVGTKALPPLINGLAWIMDHGDMIVASIIAYNVATKGMLITTKVVGALQLFNVQMKLAALTTTKTGTALALYTLKGQLAAKASTLLAGGMSSVALIAGGIVVAGIAALVVGMKKYSDSLDNTTNLAKKHKKELEELRKEHQEQIKQSDKMLESRLAEIETSELYSERILDLVDKEGNLTGSKEDLKKAIDNYNTSMGETLLWYDEETGKIMNQNDEIQNLKKSFEDLFLIKRGNAYLESHLEEYETNNQRIRELTDNNLEASRKYRETIAGYNSELGFDIEPIYKSYRELKMLRDNDLISKQQYHDEIAKISEAGLWEEIVGIDTIVKDMDTNMSEMKGLQQFNDEYMALQKAVSEGDLSKVDDFFLDFDISGQAKSVEEVYDAIKLVKQEIEDGKTLKDLGFDFDDKELNEKLDKLHEKFKGLYGADVETYEKQLAQQQELYFEPTENAANTVIESTNAKMVADNATAANTMMNNLVTKIQNTVIPTIIIPVEYKAINSPDNPTPSGGASGSGGWAFNGASFDDTQASFSSIQPNYSRMVSLAKNVVGSVQNRVARSVGSSSIKVISSGSNGNTKVNQNINFNQPIQKPSDVTRAMNKAARDLKKVK